MEIAAAPRAGSRRGHASTRAVVRRGDVHARPGRPAGRLGRPGRDHRRQRLRQVDPARRAARPAPARRAAARRLGPGVVVGEVDQARALLPRRPSRCCDAFGAAVPELRPADVRTLLAKFGLRRRPRPAARRHALAGRADPGGARAAAGPRRQPARARRADQPPRPAGDRAARAGARAYAGHAAAGHPRPPHARGGRDEPATSTSRTGRCGSGRRSSEHGTGPAQGAAQGRVQHSCVRGVRYAGTDRRTRHRRARRRRPP